VAEWRTVCSVFMAVKGGSGDGLSVRSSHAMKDPSTVKHMHERIESLGHVDLLFPSFSNENWFMFKQRTSYARITFFGCCLSLGTEMCCHIYLGFHFTIAD
jgi:hypothetical protein